MKLPKKEEVSQEAQDTWKTEIKEKLEDLNIKMDKQLLVKEEQLTRLHDELNYYKQDEAGKFEKQMLKEVIQVREKMKKAMAGDRWGQMDVQKLIEEYNAVFDDLTELLADHLCEEFQTEPGTPFDRKIHQPKTEPTDDPALDKTVKCSHVAGYRIKEKVLSPERVTVYQYVPKENKEETEKGETL